MRPPLPSLGLRTQVLLLALILLAIPWVGYRYVLEMERFLRDAQQRSLTATARAVATALHDRAELFESFGTVPLGQAESGLYVRALPALIALDGDASDWPALTDASADAPVTFSGATVSMTPRLGKRDGFLYLLATVIDERIVYRTATDARGDALDLALVNPRGVFERFRIAPELAGAIHAMRVAGAGATPDLPIPEPRIEGVWREVPSGYVIELRMPLTMIGARLGFAVSSVDDPVGREITAMAGPTGVDHPEVLAPIVIPESQVDLILQGLGRTASRIWVVDRDHRVLAQTGTLKPQPEAGADAEASRVTATRLWHKIEEATLRRIYAQVLPRPSDDFEEGTQEASGLLASVIDDALRGTSVSRWRMTADKRAVVLSAAHPIWVGDQAAGAVVVEETTNAILSVRTQALESLFSTALIVLLLGTLTLFVFATRLSARIHRLRNEAEQAVDQQGRVRGIIASSKAGDEIGDLSRSFSTILHRLADYNAYLEHLGSRLAHEIRTPIAVVRSSLENLRLQELPGEAAIYLDRAQHGLVRLSRVVTAMVEATRLEQVLQHAERERFDLAAVVEGCVNGYRLAYPEARFEFSSTGAPVPVGGTPDLIAQMLDKIVANAVDFRFPDTPVRIRLSLVQGAAQLSVANDGPLLPQQMEGRLFQSMVSLRSPQPGAEPHLGMGLYIVRLIAEFHGGSVDIRNREDGGGVIASVSLPAVGPD